MSRVLLVDLRADTLRVADVAADDGAVRLVAEQRTPRSADLSADLRAAVRGLGSSRTPRRAVCLSDAVTAVCLDLPPAAGLAPDRVEGLVRWELEPFLDLEPGAPVSAPC